MKVITDHHDLEIKIISVFCDYSADGLWVNGASDDLRGLCEDLKLPYDEVLGARIFEWQMVYEKFDFWSASADSNAVYGSDLYKNWEMEGRLIAIEIRKIIPLGIEVEYMDERTGIRSTVYLIK